jgi:hypothetical protein
MMDLMHSLAAEQQQQQQDDSSSVKAPDGITSDSYAAFTLAQRQRLKQQVVAWLQQQQQVGEAGKDLQQQQQQQQHEFSGDLAPVPLHNVRQLRELLYAYKVRTAAAHA